MASTYDNDLRLNEMATGDGSGTWGETTNLNLSMIAEAFSYQTEATFGSDANVTATIADGASDKYRGMYIKVTSSTSLSASRDLTIGPTTVSKVIFIENSTSGSQSIIVKQGSGNSVTIPNGKSKVCFLEGTGSGAGVYDGLDKLALSANVTINNQTPISSGSTNTFTNKTFDANGTGNSITNIENADISGTAAIAFSKMANLTASKALQSDGNGDVSASGVTNTELGYLSGVTSAIQTQIQNIYPVGSIYINAAVSTNPSSLIGFGTWVRHGEGRVLVSQNDSDSSFDTLGETGGTKDAVVVDHTHSVNESAHQHSTFIPKFLNYTADHVSGRSSLESALINNANGGVDITTTSVTTGVSINSAGESGTNKNLQPYITVYMWRRTA
jgi:hypothetical protein